MFNFVTRHWKGDYTVTRSLLIHTLVPDAVLLSAHGGFESVLLSTDPGVAKSVLIVTSLLWFVLLMWQFTGCFRSASSRVGYSGSALNLYVVFFALLITVLPVLGRMLGMSDQYNRAQQEILSSREVPGKPFALTLLGDEVLAFTGEIAFGATKALVSMLAENPDISTLQLESSGGVIVEARGMANAISNEGLSTHVSSECFSACTLVYISGRTRSLGTSAKLGFHQYLVDTPYFYPWVDPAVEHDKDQQRFASQNVTPAFLNKMYLHDHDSLWIPSHAELAQAGVITEIK